MLCETSRVDKVTSEERWNKSFQAGRWFIGQLARRTRATWRSPPAGVVAIGEPKYFLVDNAQWKKLMTDITMNVEASSSPLETNTRCGSGRYSITTHHTMRWPSLFFFDDFYQAINWKLVWPCQHCPHRIVKEGTCWRNGDWKSLQVYFSLSRSQTPQSLSLTTNPNYYAYCLIHQTQIVASASLFVSCRAAKKIYIAQQIGVSSANDFDAASVWQGVYTF